jgi:nucleotide-binding universal stress UspA family protein
VIATLDNGLAAKPVLSTALALATLLGADVEAVHVRVDGARTARSAAEAAGLELQTRSGPVVEQLLEAARSEDVLAVVVGARATPAGRRPLGSTALALASSLAKPVVVVPPDAVPTGSLRRVLVPVEGPLSTSFTPRAIVKLVEGAELEIVLLHVHQEDSLPAFTDQPQHEQPAWSAEFLRRYCPWGVDRVQLELRVGRTAELVPLVAEQARVDLIALGWAQELAAGRAPVVRRALAESRLPVLLVPVNVPIAGGSRAPAAAETALSRAEPA